MLGWILIIHIFFSIVCCTESSADASLENGCRDVFGKAVMPGDTYVPGPDFCTVCQCNLNGTHKFCRAVLCQPRQDCSSFRTGATCCDFICLDDVYHNAEGGPDHPLGEYPGSHGENSLGVRLAAAILTALCAFVLLLFLVHRLRQRRITAQQYVNAQDACCHVQTYWHSSDQAQLFLNGGHPPWPPWKPPSYSMDAPPPYTEADARRAELAGAGASAGASAAESAQSEAAGRAISNPMDRITSTLHHQAGAGHSRTDSFSDSYTRMNSSADVDMEGHGISSVGHSRNNSSSFVPANLGPLAVQLLPSSTMDNNNLREQIQRQRQNLTNSTRTLPRASCGEQSGSCRQSMEASSGTLPRAFINRNKLSLPKEETQNSSVIVVDEMHQEEAACEPPENEVLISSERLETDDAPPQDDCEEPQEEISEEPGNDLAEESSASLSHVRQSVLKFEAAAAAVSDAVLDSPKH